MTFSSLPGLCIRWIYDISRDGPYIFEEKLYLFIYLLIERWPKCADLWTFGKDWWVSFFSSTFQTNNNTALRTTRRLRKPWSSLPTLRMGHLYTYGYSILFSLLFFTNCSYTSPSKGNLPYHSPSKELPNTPGKVLVCLPLVLLVKCNYWHCCDRKYHHPYNRNHRSRTIWQYWN